VSSEIITRLGVYPNMRCVLDALPPKLLELSSRSSPIPVDLTGVEMDLDTRVQRVAARIHAATFTGSGDKPRVVRMHKEYVARIAKTLTRTLALALAAEDDGVMTHLEMPTITLPPATPLRLAASQLLLHLPPSSVMASSASRAGGEGEAELVVIREGGSSHGSSHAVRVLGGGTPVAVSYDSSSQRVLPWRVPMDSCGWEALWAALWRDAESCSGGCVSRVARW
jgi:hypothetical protein